MNGRDWTVRRYIGIRFFLVFSLLFSCLMGVGASSQAQTIDSSLLKQFENLQGSDRRTSTRSPVNESREQGSGSLNRDDFESGTGMQEKEDEDFSAIELDYQRRASALLEQFGYDLFDNSASQQDAVTGRVSDNYVLGVGDEIVVTFHGSTSGSQIVPVDREGRVLIDELPPIDAAGRRFSEVRDDIRERTSSALIGTEAFVSVGALKMISVYVVGEVRTPGLYRMTGLSTVLDALNNAGGVKKTGSLRRIRVHSGEGTERVDLYDLFTGGAAGDVSLQDGDRIVVPTIGATAAVAGSVVRPGIYEMSGTMTVDDLVKLAGGSLRPSGYGLVVKRIGDRGEDLVVDADGSSKAIRRADILMVFNQSGGEIGGVELVGHVREPGIRTLSKGTMLSDILTDVGILKDAPYLLFGVIETTDPASYAKILKPFSPMKVLFGDVDYELKQKDRIIFFGRDDIEFLSSNVTRSVVLTGEYEDKTSSQDLSGGEYYQEKVCRPLEELARIVRDTRSERFAAAVRAVFVQVDASESRSDDQVGKRAIESIRGEEYRSFSGRANEASAAPSRGFQESANFAEMDVQKHKKEDELAHLREEYDPDCPEVYGLVRNMLPFVLEYVTSADGAVRMPGVYPVVGDTPVSALAAVAGGTTNIVDLTNVELLSLDLRAEKGEINFKRTYVDATITDLSRVSVNPGSSVRFNTVFVEQESGGVLLDGEFRRPGVYTIRRGEKLSELIKRAGGLTEQAYPYGAVFTRERVKRAQEEGFKRAERELNMGLATAALKQKELSADTLLAAQQLSASLSSVEAIGRVVIEADPRVLEARPSLDTVLEPGDQIFIPKRPNYVLMLGDVLNQGAVQFRPGKDVKDYLQEAGGIQKTADGGRIYVVLPNGEAKPIKTSSWGGSSNVMIPPGTSIIVPKDVEPIDTLMLVRDLSSIFGQLAVSAASIAVISR